MSFGKMTSFADVKARTKTKDSEGFVTETETTLASVRCYHEQRHGSERWANMSAFSEATDLFRFRTIPGVTVTASHFILCDGIVYDIVSAEDVKGRGMYIEVLARRVVPSHG